MAVDWAIYAVVAAAALGVIADIHGAAVWVGSFSVRVPKRKFELSEARARTVGRVFGCLLCVSVGLGIAQALSSPSASGTSQGATSGWVTALATVIALVPAVGVWLLRRQGGPFNR